MPCAAMFASAAFTNCMRCAWVTVGMAAVRRTWFERQRSGNGECQYLLLHATTTITPSAALTTPSTHNEVEIRHALHASALAD